MGDNHDDSQALSSGAKGAGRFDSEGLLSMVEGNDELLGELLDLLRTEGPAIMKMLTDALARRDAEGVRHAAHKFKGTLSSFCAQTAYELAGQVETLAEAGNIDDADALVRRLDAEFRQLLPELEAFVRGRTGS